MQDAELARDALRVRARTVRKDQAPARQRLDGLRQLGMLGHDREVDVVHIVEEGLRAHLVHLHKATERRAELAVVALLQMARVRERHAEEVGDELAHLLVDLGEEIALRRIERVVEVEDPGLRRIEARTDGGLPRSSRPPP
jgi:hypothetical protein